MAFGADGFTVFAVLIPVLHVDTLNSIAVAMAVACIGAWALMAAEMRRTSRKALAKRVTTEHVL
jgi:hypothetical protein